MDGEPAADGEKRDEHEQQDGHLLRIRIRIRTTVRVRARVAEVPFTLSLAVTLTLTLAHQSREYQPLPSVPDAAVWQDEAGGQVTHPSEPAEVGVVLGG